MQEERKVDGLRIAIAATIIMLLALVSHIGMASAQSVSINSLNPPSSTTVKNQELSTSVSYTITGSLVSCSIEVSGLPGDWTTPDPKSIECTAGTFTEDTPKITPTSTASSHEITVWVKGKDSSTGLSKQDSRAFYVTVKEGAILEGSLLSSSSITAVKGATYKIEFNIENNGDMDSDNAVAGITCPSGYSCPPTVVLKEAGQNNGVIGAGKTAYASFDITATSPKSGNLDISISATNSQITDSITVSLSYPVPDPDGGTDGETSSFYSAPEQYTVNASRGKADITIVTIVAGQSANITIDKTADMAIRGIEIVTKRSVSNVKISIVKLAQKPAGLSELAGSVYHFISITKENLGDDDIDNAVIRFAVEKSWVNAGNIDPSTIILNRWQDGGWQRLQTEQVSEDSSEIIYKAELTGLSVFAITGDEKAVVPSPVPDAVCGNGACESGKGETQENCCQDCGCPLGKVCSEDVCKTIILEAPLPVEIIAAIIIVILAIAAASYYYIRIHKRHSYIQETMAEKAQE